MKNHVTGTGVLLIVCLLLSLAPSSRCAANGLTGFDRLALSEAKTCRNQVVARLLSLIDDHKLTLDQLFDTFYVPIPKTYPQKFHTQYDKITDKYLQKVLDTCLQQNSRFIYVVAVDRNGYIPTHNSGYSQPLVGNPDLDTKMNRTKRIFDDKTGLAAAHNTKPYLLQLYSRDTGETMADLSVPINIRGRHWGALRVGYVTKQTVK